MRLALALLVITGCVGRDLDEIGIACTADSECPDDAWCDLALGNNVCRSRASSEPPHIVFDGFFVGTTVVASISVPPTINSIKDFALRDDSTTGATVFTVLDGPACADAHSFGRSDGDNVEAGKTLDSEFEVEPAAGCASPIPLTLTVTADHRVFTFTTSVSITP